jgi:hypothetical protein
MKKWILSAVLVFTGQAFAGQTLNDQVDLETVPSSPVVILGDTMDPFGRTIHGPWFANQIKLINKSTQFVTVVAVNYTIESTGGGPLSLSFNPSDWNTQAHCGAEEYDMKFTFFGEFFPGDSGHLRVIPDAPVPCWNGSIATFYAGGLPANAGRADYRYKVTARVLGWFGTYANPVDRLDKTAVFYTQ